MIRSRYGGLAVILLAGVVAAPVALHAQSATTARVGVLLPSDDSTTTFLPAFRQGLRDLGYVEGRTVSLEERSANGRTDRLPSLARELVRMKVDVLVTITSPGVRAAREATSTIPIVAGAVDDAVEQGFVASLAHPGGNVTGVSRLNTELSAKRVEFLKEVLPKVTRVAVLREAVGGASSIQATATAARALRVQLQIFELRDPNELPAVFAAMAKERIEALTVVRPAGQLRAGGPGRVGSARVGTPARRLLERRALRGLPGRSGGRRSQAPRAAGPDRGHRHVRSWHGVQ